MFVYAVGLVAQRGEIQHPAEQGRDAVQCVTPKVAGRLLAGPPGWTEFSSTHRRLTRVRLAAVCRIRVVRSSDPRIGHGTPSSPGLIIHHGSFWLSMVNLCSGFGK